MKLKKYYSSVIAFMLLFPFRLPISVLLIITFNKIANLAGEVVPDDVMCANVVITKLVYNIILGAWFTYSVDKLIEKTKGRRPNQGSLGEKYPCFWITLVVGILVASYAIYDTVATYQLFWPIIGKPMP